MAPTFTRDVKDNSTGLPDADVSTASAGREYYGAPLANNGGLEQQMVTDFVFDGVTGGTPPYFFDFSGVVAAASLRELVAADVWEDRLESMNFVGPGAGVVEAGKFVFRVRLVPRKILATYVNWQLDGELYIAPGSYIRITDAAGEVTNVSFGNNDDFGLAAVPGVSGFLRRFVAGPGSSAPLVTDWSAITHPQVGVPFSFTVTTTGGIRPYRYRESIGSPNANFDIDRVTGTITGTAVASGLQGFQFFTIDATGHELENNLILNVDP